MSDGGKECKSVGALFEPMEDDFWVVCDRGCDRLALEYVLLGGGCLYLHVGVDVVVGQKNIGLDPERG